MVSINYLFAGADPDLNSIMSSFHNVNNCDRIKTTPNHTAYIVINLGS
jgi:hypothetical protein